MAVNSTGMALLSMFGPLQFNRLSVRARLGLIQGMLMMALATVGIISWEGIEQARRASEALAALSHVQKLHLIASTTQDALRANVHAAMRVTVHDSNAAGSVVAAAKENSRRLTVDLDAVQSLKVSPDLKRELDRINHHARSYLALANTTVAAAVRGREQALASESEFERAFDRLLALNDHATLLLSRQIEQAERHSLQVERTAKLWITVVAVGTALVAWFFVAAVVGSIRRSLRNVSEAARALAAGNLSVRSQVSSRDEVGELAGAVNKMADDLQNMIDRLLADADRDAFTSQLMQALDMADTEPAIRDVVNRAMAQVSGNLQMELLLADTTGLNIQRVASHPINGSPQCGVDSLSNCVAVRRGSTVAFDDSDALNACPKLRDRPCGAVSAVCVPVSFMGRSLGVLHAVNPQRRPSPPQQVAQLSALGTQTGTRIGTVRALERTHSHAYTDALTGLNNRRALEQHIEQLPNDASYAVVLADLDHFKRLNDTQGHEAGDRALRVFADTLKKCVRQADRVARWGGEEFAILFENSKAEQVIEVIDRARGAFAESLLVSGMQPITASFGIADSTMGKSFEDVLRIADAALYASKRTGRDRATVGTKPSVAPVELSPAELSQRAG